MKLRIVDMMQNGELDPLVAMQLLGNTHRDKSIGGAKRSAPDGESPKDGPDSANAEPQSDDGESLDELLRQAKKAKMDSWFILIDFFKLSCQI